MSSLLLWSAISMDGLGVACALDFEGTNVNEVDECGDSALMIYCKMKSIPEMDQAQEQFIIPDLLLQSNINVDIQNDEGKTALMLAIENSNIQDTIWSIVEHGADVNIKDSNGKTALMCAVERDMRPIIFLLLSKNADVTCVDNNKNSVTHYASIGTDVSILQNLIHLGADVNAKDISNITPLMVASMRGDIKMVDCLIENGALLSCRDCRSWDASTWAAWGRNEDIATYLLKRRLRIHGLFRTIPFMMLWRKRATERLYHPRNMQKFLPIDCDHRGQIRIHHGIRGAAH